jgi:hypothetical protein
MKATWKNESTIPVSCIDLIRFSNGIGQAIVHISTESILIMANPIKLILIAYNPSVDQILLKELFCVKDGWKLMLSSQVQSESIVSALR